MSPFKSCVVLCVFAAIVASAFADVSVDLLNSIDDLDREQTVQVFGGLSVERVADANVGAGRSGTESVLDRVERYMEQHEIKFAGFETDDGQVQGEFMSYSECDLLFMYLRLQLKTIK